MNESDIQNKLHENFKELQGWLFQGIKDKIPTQEDLLFSPLKYLLYKKYWYLHNKMQNFEDSLHVFPKEYNTAESGNSRPRVDILAYSGCDYSTFYITEVKWNSGPERQTITELLQYSNGLQLNDFPGLPNDDIVFIIVANDWTNILTQSIINGILFRDLNILPIKVSENKKHDLVFEFYDLWNSKVVQTLDQEIYNEKNYITRMVAFDEFEEGTQNGGLEVDYDEMTSITTNSAHKYSECGLIGYILGMERSDWLVYKNAIAITQLNPFEFNTKNWGIFTKEKANLLYEFQQDSSYNINTEPLRRTIQCYFPNRNIDFEEGDEEIGLTGHLGSSWLFSYGCPTGFLYTLIEDLIKFCQNDRSFAELIVDTSEVHEANEISHYMYLIGLFEVGKSGTRTIDDFEKYKYPC